jgi:hypothetical protein
VSVLIVIPQELVDLFESGVSILVGTRDASLMPEATRATGAIVHPDQRITIFLPAEVATRALANLKDNGQIAVGFSRMLDHTTIQVKGRVAETCPASDADREIITRYHAAYAENLSMVGIPKSLARQLNVWPSIAVTFEVTDIFQQTPGPCAGDRFKSGASPTKAGAR